MLCIKPSSGRVNLFHIFLICVRTASQGWIQEFGKRGGGGGGAPTLIIDHEGEGRKRCSLILRPYFKDTTN